jgi:hypothetical protein
MSQAFETYVKPSSFPPPAFDNWDQYPGLNCYDGNGANELGFRGYVATAQQCMDRCLPSEGCTGITIAMSGNNRACHIRNNIVIDECRPSRTWETYVVAAAGGPDVGMWAVYPLTNCFDGNGGEEVGLLGYFATVNECKAACVASNTCEGITVSSGDLKACNAIRNVNVGSCSTRTTVWSTHVLISPPSGATRLSGKPGVGPSVIATWDSNPNATTAPAVATPTSDDGDLLIFVLLGVGAVAAMMVAAVFVKNRFAGTGKLSVTRLEVTRRHEKQRQGVTVSNTQPAPPISIEIVSVNAEQQAAAEERASWA